MSNLSNLCFGKQNVLLGALQSSGKISWQGNSQLRDFASKKRFRERKGQSVK
jgi:hypothetical protein